MKIIVKQYLDNLIKYPVEKIDKKDSVIFLDIETTGFSSKTCMIYLIGCCYLDNGRWTLKQWLAESPADELLILKDFISFTENFSTMIHFNGNQFDLPFIANRCEKYDINFKADSMNGVDIYKRIYPYRFFLKLPNCKQKTIEEWLGIDRQDTMQGGELIPVYQEYCHSFDADALQLLLQHNADDVAGMLKVLPILLYSDFFHETYHIRKVQSNSYRDANQDKKKELLISFQFEAALPKPLSYHANDCYFSANGTEGILKIPVYQEEMKFFYTDYKDYYYLPEEDMAIHKSVSAYVDTAFRKQATASNCYTRKFSTYLPQWDYLFEPFFKRDYQSKNLFFELTEELKTNRDAFSLYVSHILSMLVKEH